MPTGAIRAVSKKALIGYQRRHGEMHNLMVFLDGEDFGKGYRYARQSDFVPELAWVREGVREAYS